MNDTAEVYLWGTRIGIIHQDITKAYASFSWPLGMDSIKYFPIISKVLAFHYLHILLRLRYDEVFYGKCYELGELFRTAGIHSE